MPDQKDKGRLDQMKGKAKELAGRLRGDRKQEVKGKAQKTGGKAREGVGNLSDRMAGGGRNKGHD